MNAAEIWNTPGYYYAIGYALSTIVIFLLQRPAIPLWRKWLQPAGMLACLLAFMLLTPGATGLAYVVDMTVIVAFLYLNIRSVVPDRMKAGFFCIKAFIFGELSASLGGAVELALADFDHVRGLCRDEGAVLPGGARAVPGRTEAADRRAGAADRASDGLERLRGQ